MAIRAYSETVKKWAIRVGIAGGTLIGLIFAYLIAVGAITPISVSKDYACAGDSYSKDSCIARMRFLVNEQDIFLYPTGYDPYGRNTSFAFDPNVKEWKLQMKWGTGWRDIPLDRGCTGTWCGGTSSTTSSNPATYSFALRKARVYEIRILALKYNPTDKIKWGAFNGVIDPYFLPVNLSEVEEYVPDDKTPSEEVSQDIIKTVDQTNYAVDNHTYYCTDDYTLANCYGGVSGKDCWLDAGLKSKIACKVNWIDIFLYVQPKTGNGVSEQGQAGTVQDPKPVITPVVNKLSVKTGPKQWTVLRSTDTGMDVIFEDPYKADSKIYFVYKDSGKANLTKPVPITDKTGVAIKDSADTAKPLLPEAEVLPGKTGYVIDPGKLKEVPEYVKLGEHSTEVAFQELSLVSYVSDEVNCNTTFYRWDGSDWLNPVAGLFINLMKYGFTLDNSTGDIKEFTRFKAELECNQPFTLDDDTFKTLLKHGNMYNTYLNHKWWDICSKDYSNCTFSFESQRSATVKFTCRWDTEKNITECDPEYTITSSALGSFDHTRLINGGIQLLSNDSRFLIYTDFETTPPAVQETIEMDNHGMLGNPTLIATTNQSVNDTRCVSGRCYLSDGVDRAKNSYIRYAYDPVYYNNKTAKTWGALVNSTTYQNGNILLFDGFFLAISGGQPGCYAQYNSSASNSRGLNGNGIPVANLTYLITCVWNGTHLYGYVNNTLVNTPILSTNTTANGAHSPRLDFIVGAGWNSPWQNNTDTGYFSGVIDTVFVYEGILSPNEITLMYTRKFPIYQNGTYQTTSSNMTGNIVNASYTATLNNAVIRYRLNYSNDGGASWGMTDWYTNNPQTGLNIPATNYSFFFEFASNTTASPILWDATAGASEGGCTPSLTNTSWTNISCLPDNTMNQSLVQYDANFCGGANETFYRSTEYCLYPTYPFVVYLFAEAITNSSITMNLTASEPVNYQATYGLSPSCSGVGIASTPIKTVEHIIELIDLLNGTAYCFNITSMCDEDSVCNETGYNFSFVTLNNPPVAVIPYSVLLVNDSTTNQSATINFTATEAVNLTYWYGFGTCIASVEVGTGSIATFSELTQIPLTGLTNLTDYCFKVTQFCSVSSNCNETDIELDFTTAQNQPPAVPYVIAHGIKPSRGWSAQLNLSTNVDTRYEAYYGVAPNCADTFMQDILYYSDRDISIPGMIENTTYCINFTSICTYLDVCNTTGYNFSFMFQSNITFRNVTTNYSAVTLEITSPSVIAPQITLGICPSYYGRGDEADGVFGYMPYRNFTITGLESDTEYCAQISVLCYPGEDCYDYIGINLSFRTPARPECFSDTDCSACMKCVTDVCVDQTSAEDLKDDCDLGRCGSGLCDGAGACTYSTGEQTCPACFTCDGTFFDCVLTSEGLPDSEGSSTCTDCNVCVEGACTVEDGTDYSDYCTGLDCGASAVNPYYGWLDYSCYYLANETIDEHVCSAGSCAIEADACIDNAVDAVSEACQCAKAATDGTCTGTTAGTCHNELCISEPLYISFVEPTTPDGMISATQDWLFVNMSIYSITPTGFQFYVNGEALPDISLANLSGGPLDYTFTMNYSLPSINYYYYGASITSDKNETNTTETRLFAYYYDILVGE